MTEFEYQEKLMACLTGYLSVAKDCHLCGDVFTVGLYDTDTICPRCKELWQKIIKESGNEYEEEDKCEE